MTAPDRSTPPDKGAVRDQEDRTLPFLTPIASGFEGCEPQPDDLLSRKEIEALDARLDELRRWRARSEVSSRGYVIH